MEGMTTAKEAIERLKQRVAQREAGSVIVDSDGGLHNPRDVIVDSDGGFHYPHDPNSEFKGKKVKPIVHGDCPNGKLV